MSIIVIAGGLVLSPAGGIEADVLVDGERITALAARGSEQARSWAASAGRVLDAAGLYVLPGGIDVHTHMEMPPGSTYSPAASRTRPAAASRPGPGRPGR